MTLNEKSKRMNVTDELMNTLATLIRQDHQDAITETQSLSLCQQISK